VEYSREFQAQADEELELLTGGSRYFGADHTFFWGA